jgi:pyridoxal phosphate enzyme (YggS family)
VGVTKAVGIPEAAALVDAGVRDLGENRPEQLAARAAAPELSSARWHLIGTYQRRKVRDTLGPVALVHSVDSIPLAKALSDRAVGLSREVGCLVQVNVSGEASKHGFAPSELPKALDALRGLPGLRWLGLMTMAPEAAPLADCRRIFASTRQLRDRVRDARLPLDDLSMGMSRDYAEAVLEGATLVRIGSALFEPAREGGLG